LPRVFFFTLPQQRLSNRSHPPDQEESENTLKYYNRTSTAALVAYAQSTGSRPPKRQE